MERSAEWLRGAVHVATDCEEPIAVAYYTKLLAAAEDAEAGELNDSRLLDWVLDRLEGDMDLDGATADSADQIEHRRAWREAITVRSSQDAARRLAPVHPVTSGTNVALVGLTLKPIEPTAAEVKRLRGELRATHEDNAMGAHSLANTTVDATARAEAVEKERVHEWNARRDAEARRDVAKAVADSERSRAEAAEALLRDLDAIINPHEAYDATKILGWARDTVERAREAEAAEAQAADLRAALEEVGSRTTGLATVAWNAGQNPKGPWAEREREERVALAKYINAAINRTPAQSLARVEARVWGEAAEKVSEWAEKLLGYERAAVIGCAANLTEIATSREEAENGR